MNAVANLGLEEGEDVHSSATKVKHAPAALLQELRRKHEPPPLPAGARPSVPVRVPVVETPPPAATASGLPRLFPESEPQLDVQQGTLVMRPLPTVTSYPTPVILDSTPPPYVPMVQQQVGWRPFIVAAVVFATSLVAFVALFGHS